MAISPLLTESASALARRIRERELRVTEVVGAHLDWMERRNPALNAIVESRHEHAMAEAEEAEARLERGRDGAGELPPFFGVPCTIKESFQVEGMRQTAGATYRSVVSTEDAPTVRSLRESGAIPIGTTNVSELLMWMESSNSLYGRSNNAYDEGRIAGGSSGGEGVAVGAGISPFGLGADIGGSIRLPAFFNGVFGHKPTPEVVSNEGQWPLPQNEAMRYLGVGPLARRAEDLWPLLQVLGSEAALRQIGERAPVDYKRLRVLYVADDGWTPVSPSLREAHKRAARALEERGATVIPTRIEGLKRAILLWSTLMSDAAEVPFDELLFGEAARPLMPELVRFARGRSPHTFPALGLAVAERLVHAIPSDVEGLRRERDRLREEILDRLGDYGVMLYPPYSRPAPRHLRPLLTPTHWVYTAAINVLMLPSTQVPLGLNARGLPTGVQVITAPYHDALSIGVAEALEEDFGGWVPPWRR